MVEEMQVIDFILAIGLMALNFRNIVSRQPPSARTAQQPSRLVAVRRHLFL